MAAFSGISEIKLEHTLIEAGNSVFGIVAFLLSAMTLVEILIHYNLFDVIRIWLIRLKLTEKKQFIMISFVTFFLSAILDNLTVTIIMIQIARKFFKGNNFLVMTANIVIMANAGGAWSPIGDVTTIMLWLADKFTALEIIRDAIVPSLTIGAVSTLMLKRRIENVSGFPVPDEKVNLSPSEKLVIGLTFVSFIFPLIMNLIHLPPYVGLLFGLGLVWTLIEFLQTKSSQTTHLEAKIDSLVQKTDIASLKFFIGILLAVAALEAQGILEIASHAIFGENPDFIRLVMGNTMMGLLSAVVDNVPLTALSINLIKVSDPLMWVLTAIAVGTGGSCLLIGSASGVIAMGMVKDLTFGKYLKIASLPALFGYLAGIGVWLLQYRIFS